MNKNEAIAPEADKSRPRRTSRNIFSAIAIKFESDTEIGQKGMFFKGLVKKLGPAEQVYQDELNFRVLATAMPFWGLFGNRFDLFLPELQNRYYPTAHRF